jgi:regulator of protease activity HflC (stomatin/prohibitin superfamily)
MGFFSLFAMIVTVIAILFIVRSIKVVPQQHAWVVERLGKFHAVLVPGLNFLVPFVDRLAYRHSLKEVPLDVPSQVCITRDNTQLQVDGIIYFQVTDPQRASYGSVNYVAAITQLAQTTLRSVIGKMELDKTFEERDHINAAIVSALDEAATNWGVKVLRYEIKDLTPPKEILHAMQAQITAEREKRALIAASEGRRQEQINIATGEREAFIARSEGQKQAAINSAEGEAKANVARAQGEKEALSLRAEGEAKANVARAQGDKEAVSLRAEGEAAAITTVASATATAIANVAEATEKPGGAMAVQLKVAEKAVDAFGNLARTTNALIVPADLGGVSGLLATAMGVMKGTPTVTAATAAGAKHG